MFPFNIRASRCSNWFRIVKFHFFFSQCVLYERRQKKILIDVPCIIANASRSCNMSSARKIDRVTYLPRKSDSISIFEIVEMTPPRKLQKSEENVTRETCHHRMLSGYPIKSQHRPYAQINFPHQRNRSRRTLKNEKRLRQRERSQ